MANPYQRNELNFIYRNGCAKEASKKIRDGKNKKEHIKEIMRVKGKPDTIEVIEEKRLQWYGHVKRMPEDRIPKLIMDWIPRERRKRRRPRKTWVEGVQAAMTTRNLEPDQWRNREEWRLVSGRRRQMLKNRTDRNFYTVFMVRSASFNISTLSRYENLQNPEALLDTNCPPPPPPPPPHKKKKQNREQTTEKS